MTEWCTLRALECCRTLMEVSCVSNLRIKVVSRVIPLVLMCRTRGFFYCMYRKFLWNSNGKTFLCDEIYIEKKNSRGYDCWFWRLSCNLESVKIWLIFSNSRTGMYGKGGTSPGWRIDTGCVMMWSGNFKFLQSLGCNEPEYKISNHSHVNSILDRKWGGTKWQYMTN